MPDDPHQALRAPSLAHGDDQHAAVRELLGQSFRYAGAAGGHNDAIEGAHVRPAQGAVGQQGAYGVQAQAAEAFARFQIQGAQAFHGEYGQPQGVQHGSLITGPRAHLQYAQAGPGLQHRTHEGHDIGLGNGLTVPDGQGAIVIGRRSQSFGHKQVTGHLAHGPQHGRVRNAPACDLVAHHALTGNAVIEGNGAHGRKLNQITRRKSISARREASCAGGETAPE